ncbi:ThiF family adenylyltransferase [Aggregicoccus sp. 17bor-14]|uniref:ThiF family adenylyltransferase n=1 Tax=Myxococcaceae TaxID=31 RepID=UPI00129C65BD|nr:MULTISPECIES: ThiF family adenylyltransferase [Myxococcaceae]MBF5044078.1 ThiF family adenylyltransferase [Simulacricoccus sp. 17bor-14]MRI89829.1 ThiF family adenylyltransferase [Aggregicoccus sp. 17bor-14]
MALREEQIQRYSRQILLREVGGRGQEALLDGGVRVDVAETAGCTAAAYLAAAGSPLEASARALGPGAPGFLAPASAVGESAAELLARELPDFNPDAVPTAPPRAQLAELPAHFEGPAPWVALGARGGQGAVLFRGPTACAGCFARAAEALAAPPGGALGVALGALGALLLERLVLGQGPAAGLLLLEAPGVLRPGALPVCERCA